MAPMKGNLLRGGDVSKNQTYSPAAQRTVVEGKKQIKVRIKRNEDKRRCGEINNETSNLTKKKGVTTQAIMYLESVWFTSRLDIALHT